MQHTTVREGQTLFDIAIQQCGDMHAVFEIALMNGKGITDELLIREAIITPDAPVNLLPIVDAFATKQHKPASDLTPEDLLELKGGIDYMGIQIDFKVS